MLVNFIGYKLDREGGKLVEVDRLFPSTKLCNCCKVKNTLMNLSIRDWVCSNCNTHHDRDENAAKNIREEGIRFLSTNTVGHTEIQDFGVSAQSNACGEDVRLANTSVREQFSEKQESPVTAQA